MSKKVAFLVASEGIEQIELTGPWDAVVQSGATAHLVSPKAGQVQAFTGYDRSDKFDVDLTVADVNVNEYVGLVLPGGVGNPDELRLDEGAVKLVRSFLEAGKPVAAICHAAWVLAEAGVIKNRKLTSWKSVRTDLVNAGAEWIDTEVVVDTNGPGVLITSRDPNDLPAFNKAIVSNIQ